MTKSVETFFLNLGILLTTTVIVGIISGIIQDLTGWDTDFFFGFATASIFYSHKRK